MPQIAIAGLLTLETSVRVPAFPLHYAPIHYPFHGITQAYAGVGFNAAVALARLGHAARLATLVGDDEVGRGAWLACQQAGLDASQVLCEEGQASSQTVVLVDGSGRRQIHCDLKDLQNRQLPAAQMHTLLAGAELAVLGNINFARPLLALARQLHVPVATDVHALHDFDDPYNRDFMASATLLFLSHEKLPCAPAQAVAELRRRYSPALIVIGMGDQGALLSVQGESPVPVAAVTPRPVVNTVGAGDALFCAFVDQWLRGASALQALERAVWFAGWKVGEHGATRGLLSRAQWRQQLEPMALL
jgi:acarbose 7IV-phosphotransferase